MAEVEDRAAVRLVEHLSQSAQKGERHQREQQYLLGMGNNYGTAWAWPMCP